jgi:hypothetical protein
MKAHGRSGDINPLVFKLCTKWRFVVSLTPRSPYRQRRRPSPLNKRLAELQYLSENIHGRNLFA